MRFCNFYFNKGFWKNFSKFLYFFQSDIDFSMAWKLTGKNFLQFEFFPGWNGDFRWTKKIEFQKILYQSFFNLNLKTLENRKTVENFNKTFFRFELWFLNYEVIVLLILRFSRALSKENSVGTFKKNTLGTLDWFPLSIYLISNRVIHFYITPRLLVLISNEI